jgi:hypothetical protein
MAKALTLSQALRLFLLVLATGFILYYGGRLSEWLIRRPDASLARRWLGVLVAVLALGQWIFIVAKGAIMGDEFQRRIVLLGTAVAFVGDILLQAGFSVMQDARIVSADTYLPSVPAAALLWMLGVGAAVVHYRARP